VSDEVFRSIARITTLQSLDLNCVTLGTPVLGVQLLRTLTGLRELSIAIPAQCKPALLAEKVQLLRARCLDALPVLRLISNPQSCKTCRCAEHCQCQRCVGHAHRASCFDVSQCALLETGIFLAFQSRECCEQRELEQRATTGAKLICQVDLNLINRRS
jgi:hypothetical protein